jgi:hypothetical protein
MLFNNAISKVLQPVRVASAAILGKIRETVENALAGNSAPVLLPRGMIVSLYWQVDDAHVVRPTDSDKFPPLGPDTQYMGVLEADLPAAAPGDTTYATCRHDGKAFVLMSDQLDPHVGDAVYAGSGGDAGFGVLGPPSRIYVGEIHDITGYNPLAAIGTTGLTVLLKHSWSPPGP